MEGAYKTHLVYKGGCTGFIGDEDSQPEICVIQVRLAWKTAFREDDEVTATVEVQHHIMGMISPEKIR